ncbi:MAG: hypothetical protein ACK55Z_34130 [bacterium]
MGSRAIWGASINANESCHLTRRSYEGITGSGGWCGVLPLRCRCCQCYGCGIEPTTITPGCRRAPHLAPVSNG